MVTTLYIIRHCQSAGNLTGRFQGRFDAPVSEAGEKQLDLLSLRFRNEHLDAIYSSPLIRAYRTAEAVNNPTSARSTRSLPTTGTTPQICAASPTGRPWRKPTAASTAPLTASSPKTPARPWPSPPTAAVFGNTSVSVLEAENGALRWKLVNDMSHLPEELRRAPMQYTFHTEAL